MSADLSHARKTVFGVVCGAHFFNHFQSTMLGVLYPVMMKDLGIGFVAIGSITAAYNLVGSLLQGFSGFVVPYVRRGVLLGAGNVLLGLSVCATGFASSLYQILTVRFLGGIGSSPQHPIGSSILASHFEKARGRTLALHSASGQFGALVAPILAALLLAYVSWRAVFWIVGVLTFIVGLACFFLTDHSQPAASAARGGQKARPGWDAYKKCLQNKNLMVLSLVLMVGAAGRGQGINETYLIPHFVNDFQIDVTYAAFLFMLIQIGSFLGPFLWGWVSDRWNRILTIQTSLLLSGLSNLWLAWQGHVSLLLLANLVFYGAVVHSRQTLTQALLSDIVEPDLLDAAFSLYFLIGFISIPFWTIATGWIMSHYGFSIAFTLISSSYIAAMIIMLFLRAPAVQRS
ncbi:MAG TPA: MFS transporter [Candidatus Acidoferrales bacterium]|nr:MFS transporter [Candidatus Acidoferrales bacterium]